MRKQGKIGLRAIGIVGLAGILGGSGGEAVATCTYLEGYCFSPLELVGLIGEYLDGPGAPLQNDRQTIALVRTMHFDDPESCPGLLGCAGGEPQFGLFACSMPQSPAYTCFAMDTWEVNMRRFDADIDGDIDLRDFARLQNGEFTPQ